MTDRRVRPVGPELQILIPYNLPPSTSAETEASGYQSRYLSLPIGRHGLV